MKETTTYFEIKRISSLEVLKSDLDFKNQDQLLGIVHNPITNEEILENLLLANQGNVAVIKAVADRKNLSERRIREFAKHENWLVRHRIATNPSTPFDVLDELILDEVDYVKQVTISNPSLTAEKQIEYAELNKNDTDVLYYLLTERANASYTVLSHCIENIIEDYCLKSEFKAVMEGREDRF